MILTEQTQVLFAADYEDYESLNKLSSQFGYSSQKTFARVLAALQKQRNTPVRTLEVGKRIKFNRLDIQNLLA
jgi:hypothetical protein